VNVRSGAWLRRALFGIFGAGLLVASWSVWLEPGRLVVTKAELDLPRWPSELSGLKVALLADLHVGSPHWDLGALAKLVERCNALEPDLVLLAGDYQINDVMGGEFVEVPCYPPMYDISSLRLGAAISCCGRCSE
jgi:hypothetical protein